MLKSPDNGVFKNWGFAQAIAVESPEAQAKKTIWACAEDLERKAR